jgi:hypothetical protein
MNYFTLVAGYSAAILEVFQSRYKLAEIFLKAKKVKQLIIIRLNTSFSPLDSSCTVYVRAAQLSLFLV